MENKVGQINPIATDVTNESPELAFIEIESPMPPGIDWGTLMDSAVWLFIVFLGVMVLIKFSRAFYGPQRLRWQLKSIENQVNNPLKKGVLANNQAWLLYNWAVKLQPLLEATRLTCPPHQAIALHTQYDVWWQRVNEVSFSKQAVSRETFNSLIKTGFELLDMVAGWPALRRRGQGAARYWILKQLKILGIERYFKRYLKRYLKRDKS